MHFKQSFNIGFYVISFICLRLRCTDSVRISGIVNVSSEQSSNFNWVCFKLFVLMLLGKGRNPSLLFQAISMSEIYKVHRFRGISSQVVAYLKWIVPFPLPDASGSPKMRTRVELSYLHWFGLVLWYINYCRLLNAKSIFKHINSSISKNSVYHRLIYEYSKIYTIQ